MTDQLPGNLTLSDEVTQDASAGKAVDSTTVAELQAQLASRDAEIENAHRLAEQERKRADDLVGLLGKRETPQPRVESDGKQPYESWNEIVQKESPEAFIARVQSEAVEKAKAKVMEELQALAVQTNQNQSKRQVFNNKFPDLAGVSDDYLFVAFQSALRENPALERYSADTQAEAVAKQLRANGFVGGGGAINQNRTGSPPKEPPAEPTRTATGKVDDDDPYSGMSREQADRLLFKKMLKDSTPAYKQVR